MRPKLIITIIFCSLLITSGLCLLFAWSSLFHCAFSLRCNPRLLQLWQKIPVEIKTEFYFFNWTNPEDIRNSTIKPRFVELGPYTFLEKQEKGNIVWNDNGTVTFQQKKTYRFGGEGNLDDEITSVDPAVAGIAYYIRNWNYYFRKAMFISLKSIHSEISGTHKVRELLFEGYPEPLITIATSLPVFSDSNMPQWERFGWMYSRNDSLTIEGVFNMGTGENGDLGKLYNWNYSPHTNFYNDRCGEILGYSGEFFPRNLSPNDTITIFNSGVSRWVSLKFAFKKTVSNILGYTFVGSDFVFDNGTINPENSCFCNGECIPTGVANISVTKHGSPVFASMPHFYGADPIYSSSVEGVEPEGQKHEIYITIEPTTGVVLEADAKLQANVLLYPLEGMDLFENVPKVFIPVLYTRQTAKIPDMEAFTLKVFLFLNSTHLWLGTALVLLPILLCLYQKKCLNRKNTINLQDDVSLNQLKR